MFDMFYFYNVNGRLNLLTDIDYDLLNNYISSWSPGNQNNVEHILFCNIDSRTLLSVINLMIIRSTLYSHL